MQLVISGNRIIAHGENFLALGGVVINTVTGKKYENATVAECDGCPSDIDSVGYEYHAGQFVPCAPFGVGKGNVAVVCGDDCKAVKDSGIPMENFAASEYTTYRIGTGDSVSLTFNISPDVVFITTYDTDANDYVGLILGDNLICIKAEGANCLGTVDRDGNTISWDFSGVAPLEDFTRAQTTYQVFAFSVKGAH